jgi:hypothetical protein
MTFAVVSSLYPHPITAFKGSVMTATYTFDVFSSLDGYGSHRGDWGGYWGKQGPELLERRAALYANQQRMIFGAKPTGCSCAFWARAPRGPNWVTAGSPR